MEETQFLPQKALEGAGELSQTFLEWKSQTWAGTEVLLTLPLCIASFFPALGLRL